MPPGKKFQFPSVRRAIPRCRPQDGKAGGGCRRNGIGTRAKRQPLKSRPRRPFPRRIRRRRPVAKPAKEAPKDKKEPENKKGIAAENRPRFPL